MTALRDDLADHILRVDAGNRLGPHQLGHSVAWFLREAGAVSDDATENAVEDFVAAANAGVGYLHPKRLTGQPLADAIVDRFNLDEEI